MTCTLNVVEILESYHKICYIYPISVTNPREADNHSACQEITNHVCKLNTHCRVHNTTQIQSYELHVQYLRLLSIATPSY
jgi:hypothetical protein